MKKITLFLLFLFSFSSTSQATPTNFECSGESYHSQLGNTVVENMELVAETKPASLYGYRTGPAMAWACIMGENITESCSANDLEVKCKCTSSFGNSIMTLSRRTGLFNVFTTSDDGKYMQFEAKCKKINKKLF